MTLNRNVQIETQDLSSGDLVLSPSTLYGYEIIGLSISGGSADNRATIQQAGTTKTNIPAHAGEDTLLPDVEMSGRKRDSVSVLTKEVENVPTYKVVPDTEFRLSGTDGTATVLYKEYTADEAPTSGDAGTATGTPYLFISNAQETDSVAASSTEIFGITSSVNPPAARDYPYEEAIPAGKTVKLIGIATNLDGSSGADITYDGLRMFISDESQLAPNEEFIDPSIMDYPATNVSDELFLFPEPYEMTGPEDVDLQVKASNSDSSAEDAIINCSLIFLVGAGGGV